MEKRRGNILQTIDKPAIILYLALGIMGWLAICGAGNSYLKSDILEFFALTERTGKQAMWMGISFIAGTVLMFIDKRSYEFSAKFIYTALILLGIITIFISKDIKGSRSWITIGSFGIQPAEFMKFGTTLALASLMSRYGFKLTDSRNFLKCLGIILLPLIVIICQNETGSALVYLSFFIVLYREGMTGIVLLSAISAVVYFVVGIGYEPVMFEQLPVSVGHYAVTAIIQIFAAGMTLFWCRDRRAAYTMLAANVIVSLAAYWVAVYLFAFNILIVQYALLGIDIVYLLLRARIRREGKLAWTAMFIVVSIIFFHSCDYVFNNVMKAHQKVRINDLSAVVTGLLLGLTIPPSSPWWMVAIGSVFAIIIVKQLFGGIGDNFLNPALTARAVLLASWPAYMTAGYNVGKFDAVTSATPLLSGEVGTLDLLLGNCTGAI
ncbi:MAG: RnfABCDGE type electron transport complex subunit D, partial [Bacteroidaceae bacterium]|nr:RnfABCDGE type electron transport complex subunit D [Bacteroidaceae bacterium]